MGRVEIFNATRPGGLDKWTMDLAQYELIRSHILEVIDDEEDGIALLKMSSLQLRSAMRAIPCFPRGDFLSAIRSWTWKRAARLKGSPGAAHNGSVAGGRGRDRGVPTGPTGRVRQVGYWAWR